MQLRVPLPAAGSFEPLRPVSVDVAPLGTEHGPNQIAARLPNEIANIARIEFAHRLNRVRDIARNEAAMVEAAPDLDRAPGFID
ncbi:MAG TPA: hypothetical protein VF210_12920 [Pseudomonadales bacterium]